jgi:hypothetical protein
MRASPHPALLLFHLLIPALAAPMLGLSLQLRHELSPHAGPGYLLLALAVFMVYTLDRLKEAGLAAQRSWLLAGLAIAACCIAWLLPQIREMNLVLSGTAGLLALLHGKAKKLPGLKNLLIALAWMLAITASSPIHQLDALALIELAGLVFSASLLCDWPEAMKGRRDGSLLAPGHSLLVLQLMVILPLLPALLAPFWSSGGAAFALSGWLLLIQLALPGLKRHHYPAALLADGALALPGLLLQAGSLIG